jgi:hypothetical protein
VPVADPADLVPVPGGRLRRVAVEREVALEQDLVRLEGRRRQVVADPPEDHVEVAVAPEVVPGQLVGEDLAERRPEVAQLVRALQRDLEVEVGPDALGQALEVAHHHVDVRRRIRHRLLGEQQPVHVRVAGHAADDEREVRRARAEVRDDQPDQGQDGLHGGGSSR